MRGDWCSSRWFVIGAGVRHGCVLSARLFCAVLQLAMGTWRTKMGGKGLDLHDDGCNLLDLRFADDILLFAYSADEATTMLDTLVEELATVGLVLNASKTIVLPSEAQPAATIITPAGTSLKVLSRSASHKWLGCMLSTGASHDDGADLEYHLQCANRAFYANRWLLCDRNVSIASRVTYFQSIVTSVACFASGHRTVYKGDLRKMDVHFRRLMRQVVGPPGGLDWSRPWHETLHAWHQRVEGIVTDAGIRTWSRECLRQHWKLASYSVSIPTHRWLPRVMRWSPRGRHPAGRPHFTWDQQLVNFCKWKQFGAWERVAVDRAQWSRPTEEFVGFFLM